MPFLKGHPRSPKAGRKKGSLNKRTIETQQFVAATGMTPLQFHTKKYLYYNSIIDTELAKEKPDVDRIDYAFMAGGIAARDAAPYVHPKVTPIEEEQPKRATIVQWNWPQEVLDRLPVIRRGKPFLASTHVLTDGLSSSATGKPESSHSPDQPDSGGRRREEAKEPSGVIPSSAKRHWSD